MRHLFLPAFLPTNLSNHWGLSPLNWLDPRLRGSACYYPNMLLSYHHWRTERRLQLDGSQFLFGDSGGFSVATQAVFLNARNVIQWQLRHCEVGPILDDPPAKIAGVPRLENDAASNWEKSIRLTVLNTKRALPYYLKALANGSRFRWWGVVHGENYKQLKQWYGKIFEVYPFTNPGEGWAFKAFPPTSPSGTARCLRFIESHNIQQAHFFRNGGIEAVTTLLCLGPEAGLDFVSYDASTPIKHGINRRLMIPSSDFLSWKIRNEKFRDLGETFARDYMKDECPCSSCQWLREDLKECPDIEDEYFKYRMSFHNLLIAVKVFDALFEASKQDPRGLLREKLGKDYKATLRAFKRPARGAT